MSCDLVIFPLSGGGQETNKKEELLSTRFCASFVQGRPMQHTHNKNPQKFVAPLARSCLFVPTGAQFGASYTYNNNTRTKPQVLVPVSAAVDPLNRPPQPKKKGGRKKVVVVVIVIVVGRAVRPARLSLSPVQFGINWSAKINSTHADKNNSSKKVKHKLNPGMGFFFSLSFSFDCV